MVESRDLDAARFVAEVALREMKEGLACCPDPVLREVIASEMAQSRRVLLAAGLNVEVGSEGK